MATIVMQVALFDEVVLFEEAAMESLRNSILANCLINESLNLLFESFCRSSVSRERIVRGNDSERTVIENVPHNKLLLAIGQPVAVHYYH